MLDEQLKTASREAARNRLKTVLKVSLFAGSTVALLLTATWWWKNINHRSESTKITEISPLPSTENDVGREDFKQALRAFEADVEPLISGSPFAQWNGEAQHQIFNTKDKAISLFGSGDYASALAEIDQAKRQAIEELRAMDSAFQDAMTKAQQYYSEDAYNSATVEITKALKLMPQNPSVLALEAQIDALPRVLELIDQANVAHTENNLRTEATNLRLITALAPNRVTVKARLVDVMDQLNELDFSAHVNAGLRYIEAEELARAKISLGQAQNIFPEREEVALLKSKIQSLSKTLTVRAMLANAARAAQVDDWLEAGKQFDAVRVIEPDNAEAVSGSQNSWAIVNLERKIDAHLQNAHRFSSPQVVADVKDILAQITRYSGQSPSLVQKSKALGAELQAYGKTIPVRIISDNETNVVVRGVGKVGKTAERYIDLKPGTYTFEGQRAGFKSRLVKITIEPNAVNPVVEIACNERL